MFVCNFPDALVVYKSLNCCSHYDEFFNSILRQKPFAIRVLEVRDDVSWCYVPLNLSSSGAVYLGIK